eukprot:scaffold4979_cov73-Cylindrotheca_fusiformis.AAC.2
MDYKTSTIPTLSLDSCEGGEFLGINLHSELSHPMTASPESLDTTSIWNQDDFYEARISTTPLDAFDQACPQNWKHPSVEDTNNRPTKKLKAVGAVSRSDSDWANQGKPKIDPTIIFQATTFFDDDAKEQEQGTLNCTDSAELVQPSDDTKPEGPDRASLFPPNPTSVHENVHEECESNDDLCSVLKAAEELADELEAVAEAFDYEPTKVDFGGGHNKYGKEGSKEALADELEAVAEEFDYAPVEVDFGGDAKYGKEGSEESLCDKEMAKTECRPASVADRLDENVGTSGQNAIPNPTRGRVYVDAVTDNDVIVENGEFSNDHPGNQAYLEHCIRLEQKYKNSNTNAKREMKIAVVKWVRDRGGRFLVRDDRYSSSRCYILPEATKATRWRSH